eukprot:s3103_g9.t1
MSHEGLVHEIHQGKNPNVKFGFGTECQCHEGQRHDAQITCGHCTQKDVGDFGEDHQKGNESLVLAAHKSPGKGDTKGLAVEEIKRKLYLLHAATGHGPVKNLVRLLRQNGAPKEVLEEAERFHCSVCQERSKPQPRNQASLEAQPKKLEVVEADVGHWVHPDNTHYQFLLYVDEGSRFRVARHIITGKREHVTAAQFITTFRECWVEYFGNPRTLRVDPDGAFRSHELSNYCDSNNVFLDIIPGEAHWKLSVCERGIQGVKELLTKLAQDFQDMSFPDLLAETIRVFNSREQIRGYSPIQHLMGRAPDDDGRFFSGPRSFTEDLCCEGPREENLRSHQLRQKAEMRFLEWSGQQRLSRAQNSKAKGHLVFHPGDLVYVWRRQVPLKEAKNKHGTGRFIGPARILATEKERDSDGSLKSGSSIWLVRGRRLLKCCVEQLRHASQREHILEELHEPEPQSWDFPRVAKELGGNDYDDLTEEPPSREELRRAADPDLEVQPSKRLRGKSRPPPGSEMPVNVVPPDLGTGTSSGSRPGRSRSRAGPAVPDSQASFVEGAHWTDLVHENFPAEPEVSGFWTEPTAAVSVAIDMPQTRSQTEKILKDLPAYFTNALKKRSAVEVSEKYMSPSELEEFRVAKGIEVTNFIAAKAFEALPSHLKVDRTRAVRMRWILTWKHKEDGSRKAKARAVLLGYMDPLYEHRSTASPTTTRQTRQMQLAVAASLGFTTEKGDVTGAFLQSRPYPSELTCIPCPEICTAMGLDANSVVRVKKACYGLVDAPLEWYRSICTFFQKLGLRRIWSDPCCWVLERSGTVRGIISGHVDDFLFSGSSSDPIWMEVREAIRKEFKWSDWESGKYTQCGVLVEEHADGTYSLSQESYISDLKYINLRSQRRKEKDAPTDAWEQSQLRTLLGGLSWVAQQTAPHLSAEVGLLLSEVNSSTIETINRANRLLDQAKGMKDHKVRIHKIPLCEMVVCAWCDAAAHNRPDGSSTQGIVVGISSKALIKGQCAPVSLVMWQSAKIGRVCRSPGASEAVAAVNAEDLLFFARFQLSEMTGHQVNIRQVNEAVNSVPGCLVTDSRNVYDKLVSEAVVPKGAERRTDLELMSLKAAQLRNQVLVRWVNSEAQLSNTLTKAREQREMMLFYRMNHHWKIVEDETMSSAKKRRQKGQTPLEDTKVNNNGWSALIWCAINGCEEVATALLSASANYLTADNEGRTACMWAARHGHLSMVETLLANGLNLLQVDDAGLTVYDHAQEQLEMRSLIAAVQQVNEELQLAVRNNDVDGVKAAIEEGADVNVQDEDGWTPLMWAALHQSLDMVQLVIRHGANPNLVDERGEVLQMLSTDHLAVGESVIEIVSCNERLLEHAKAGRWHEIDHELQIGAWVNVRDEARRTVLLWAARQGASEAVTNLVNKNADLDARDESGWLPVHWAAQSGSVETLCNLHYLGADFVSRTYVGETALHIAAQYNDGAMIQVLLASNADIEELNVDLRMWESASWDVGTALHMASVNGQTEALQTLLFYKADFEKVVEDESGMTAFLLAVTHERLSAVQCMLSDIPLPPRLPINVGTLSVAPSKKGGKRSGSREPPPERPAPPKDPKAGGAKAKAAPAPKTRVGNRKKLVKDVREKRGDHPRALLEHAAEIRAKLVKTAFGKIGRRLVNQCDLEERSALCLAVMGRQSNMVQILLSSKAELETTDHHGNGVLHYACMNRDREQVATFMDLNARVDRLNKDGLKPVDLCQEDPDILHMIERKLVSKKLETFPPSPTHVAPPVGINLEERHRIRFESPMLQTMGQEAILKELKLFIKQRGAPKAKNIQATSFSEIPRFADSQGPKLGPWDQQFGQVVEVGWYSLSGQGRLTMSRQWRGQRNDDDEDEEEGESNVSSSADRTSRSATNESKKGSIGPPPSYDGNRAAGVFEEYRIRAKLWLFSTNVESRARGPRLMQALSGRAFESVRHLIDDSDWLEATDNGEQLVELLSKPEYYGKEELESLYQSMHKLFYSDLRKDDDDLPAFRSRFEQAVRKVEKHKVKLPQEALGFLFLKQSKINAESFERLITMTNGDLKLDAVVDALRRLKMKLLDADESVAAKKRHLWMQESMDDQIPEASHEGHSDEDDLELIEKALADLDEESDSKSSEVTEDGAREILMTLIKQKINKPVSMSYKQVQNQKREVRNARGYRPVVGGSSGVTMRRDLQQLKSVTRCKSCGELGHWHKECPQKTSNQSKIPASSSGAASTNAAHGWWSLVQPDSFGDAAVVDSLKQPIEAFHYCTKESNAVVDTGCQRSAIGRSTLENISSRLPPELHVKFVDQKFRFSGIGGETVTTKVALIPVCFGQRPGMVRAAVLEDTPDAPFLLSLPILKALNTSLHLSDQNMQFQAIGECGSTFYNEKGQLCLRLFEFDALPVRPNVTPDRWHVRKIIGDECQVFMLQEPIEVPSFGKSNNHDEKIQCNDERNIVKDLGIAKGSYEFNHMPCQHNSLRQSCVAPEEPVTSHASSVASIPKDVSDLPTQPNASVQSDPCLAQQTDPASSFAETPVLSSTPCVVSHGSSSKLQEQQAGMHVSCGDRAPLCCDVASHVQQDADPRTFGYHHAVGDGLSHSVDEPSHEGTGNDDACGRHGRSGYTPDRDASNGRGEEAAGKGIPITHQGVSECIQGSTDQAQEEKQQQCGKLFRGVNGDTGNDDVSSEPRSMLSQCSQLQPTCSSSEQVLLRPEASEVRVQEAGLELPAGVLPMPKGTWEPAPMSLLPMDPRNQRRGVRADVCFFTQSQEAASHIQEVRQALQRRIDVMRRARGDFSKPYTSPSSRKSKRIDITTSSYSTMSPPMESERHQCLREDSNLHEMWPPREDRPQERRGDSEVGGCQPAQEVRTTSSSEPVNLKSGQRKHVLGEIQKAIERLEQDSQNDHADFPEAHEHCDDPMLLNDLFHLKMIGEVFSPDRFVSRSPKHGMRPGQAFDLRLGHQFLCPKQRRKCIDHIVNNPYDLVVVTPPCTMFSLLQYLGLGKSKETCMNDPTFQQKYHEACILLNFAVLICTIQSRRGKFFLFEQPWNAVSWNERCVKRLLNEPSTHLVRTDQCMFGQKDLDNQPIRKRTGFLTNHAQVASALRRTCKGLHTHQPCVGQSKGQNRASCAARYPVALIDAVLKAFARAEPFTEMPRDIQLSSIHWTQSCPDGSERDVKYTHTFHSCVDPEELHKFSFVVNPTEREVQFLTEPSLEQFASEAVANAESSISNQPLNEEESQAVEQLSPDQRRALRNEVMKAHRGMGHPNHDRFLRILRLGGASLATIGIAKTFECSQCKEDGRPKPWRRAAPPRELEFNQIVGVDTLTIKHHDISIKCLNIVCWGSRYQMILPLSGMTASNVRSAYRTWVKLFGAPRVVKPDMGTEFLGAFMYRSSTDGTEVDISSLESPTQNSITEREGGSFKTMFNKASLDYGPTNDPDEVFELIDTVNMCKNRLCHRGGYSAIHRVFGYTPAMPGDVLMSRNEEDNLTHHSMIEMGDVTLQRQARMRECAGRAFFSSECSAALRRAVASGPRKVQHFEVGQLVYFWSVGHYNKVAVHHSASRRPNHQFWNGPCRVVATQYPSSVYVSYQGRLVKAAPEQLRLASSDEDAACSEVLKSLCTIRSELRHNKISGLSDIRHEPRPTEPDPHPTGRKRHFSKQPPFDPQKQQKLSLEAIEQAMDDDDMVPSPSPPMQSPTMETSDVETEVFESDQELFQDQVHTYHGTVHTDSCEFVIWDTENDLSPSDSFGAYVGEVMTAPTSINKRAQKEIRLKDLDSHDHELFKQAIQKEWKTNIDNGAIAVIPPHEAQKIRQHSSHRIMQSRLLHVAKPIDDVTQVEASSVLNCSPNGAPCKAKSRWVARGDKDPDIFNVCVSSPVIHRDTFMLGLQAISSQQWRLHFADFSQAFMQGDSLKRDAPLYCEPPERELLGLPNNCLIEIRKTVYGLVDAPYRWNQHLDQTFKSLGYLPSLLDPCCYLLHSKNDHDQMQLDGIIMVATDDLVSGGNARHQALMEQLKSKYKFGKWEFDTGRFCGKDIQQRKDKSIHVSQQYYAEQKCWERISIPKGAQNEMPCNAEQVKQLREKVGALSWISKETRVDLAGSVSLLMQAFPCPVIGDLKTCNKILKEATLYKDIGITIRPIQPKNLCIVVSSDAAWANAKDEEGDHKSQAGYIVLSTDRSMLQGREAEFSMLSWKSHTLKRRTISTLSAETQAIVESAAVACWFRYLIAEMFYKDLIMSGSIDWETMLEPLEFGIVTDAKSVELDPITARPRGHAYADFLEEWAAEMVLQGDGKQLNGQPLRVFFEIPFQLEHPAE